MSVQFTKAPSTIALCSAANFINAADRVIMPIAIIQMTDEFKWDLHGQGWVLSAFAVGYMSSMVSRAMSNSDLHKVMLSYLSLPDFCNSIELK